MDIEVKISNYRCFTDENPAQFRIQDSIIAFVGPNNAGKSTLLKFLYEFRGLFNALSKGTHFRDAINSHSEFTLPAELADKTDIFTKFNDRPIFIDIRIEVPGNYVSVGEYPDLVPIAKHILVEIPRRTTHWKVSVMDNGVKFAAHDARIAAKTILFSHSRPKFELAHIFDICAKLGDTVYIGPFRNIINIGTREDYFDITIGQKFIEQWNALERGQISEARATSRAVVKEIRDLFGFNTFNISAAQTNQDMIIDIDGQNYLLTELGSGLAHFILVLITCTLKHPEFILIDEPELNLHPSIQLSFLTALASKAKSGVLFSTHSIGLARSSAESIYTISRVSTTQGSIMSEFDATENAAEFLGEMSYSVYESLGFNKILLVEGPTDIKTIQQFLRKMRLDNKVVILHLGGASSINGNHVSELNELKRISAKIYAIVDSERESAESSAASNVEDFKGVCESIGIKCCVLRRRATENYLSDSAVKKELGEEFNGLGHYQKLSELGEKRWPKRNNWRIAARMEIDELEGTDLYEFLLSLKED